MVSYSPILFDRVRFNKDLLDEKISSVFSYFSALSLPNGEYLWQNNLIKPNSIVQIINSSLVEINNGIITPVWPDIEVQNLMVKTLSSFSSNEIYNILYNLKDSYLNIRTAVTDKVIFKKSFNTELLYYIDEIKKINYTFISNLYLAILYYLMNDAGECKNYLISCHDTIKEYELLNYVEYLIYIENLLLFEVKSSNMRKIYFVKNTDNVLLNQELSVIFYVKRTIAAIELFTGQHIRPIENNKKEIISKLRKFKPTLLVLWGHGSLKNGYNILDGILDLKNKEHLNKDDMKELLKGYQENQDIYLFDYACSKGHFSKYNYFIPMTLFAGVKDQGMSDPSSYRYSLGFFKSYSLTQKIEDCHEIGMICLSMGSIQYVNDFVMLNVPRKN